MTTTTSEGPELLPTLINERWTLLLPPHRAARAEWPVWERERLAAMADVIGPGDVVYDIGAEEGDFPALWASWGADVVLVEPNPRVWPNIRTIFDGNGLTGHVLGWHVGFAGDHPTAGSWEHQPGQSLDEPLDRPDDPMPSPLSGGRRTGWPRCAYGPVIGDHGFLVLPERPDVPATTIDRLAVRHGAPTVITIDVEGAELTVLRGAYDQLRQSHPRVFVSVHLDLPWIDEKYPGDTGERVGEFMEALGYKGRLLATDHEEHWEWQHPNGR